MSQAQFRQHIADLAAAIAGRPLDAAAQEAA